MRDKKDRAAQRSPRVDGLALMSSGEVTFLQSGSLGQVQEALSLRVLGTQWRSRAAGANLASTSVYEWIVGSPIQRLSVWPALWGSPKLPTAMPGLPEVLLFHSRSPIHSVCSTPGLAKNGETGTGQMFENNGAPVNSEPTSWRVSRHSHLGCFFADVHHSQLASCRWKWKSL